MLLKVNKLKWGCCKRGFTKRSCAAILLLAENKELVF